MVSSPFTSSGNTFSTSISLITYGTTYSWAPNGVIDKSELIYLLVDYIEDNRDGYMSFLPSNLIITGTAGNIDNILKVSKNDPALFYILSCPAHATYPNVKLEKEKVAFGIDAYRKLGRNQFRISLFHNIKYDDLEKLTKIISGAIEGL